MKNLIITGIMLTAFGVLNLNAQPTKQQGICCEKNCKLSDNQKEQMKAVRSKYAMEILHLKNQFNELRAKQRTLTLVENPKKKEVYANIDKMTETKKNLDLLKLDMKLEMNSLLTTEQLLNADRKPMRKGGQGMAHKQADFRKTKGHQNGKCSKAKSKQHESGKRSKMCHTEMGKEDKMCQKSGKTRNNCSELNENQKEKMKELRLAHLENTKALRDEAEEIRVKQRNLMTTTNVKKSLMINQVNRLAEISNNLNKKRFDYEMEIRNLLDKDQLVSFLNRKRGSDKKCGRMH